MSRICLGESGKSFNGSCSMGIRCSDWLADTVEEALYQGKDDFVTSFYEEVEVLMLRKGSNMANCFLEAAVFAKEGRKGVIWLLEGRGRWIGVNSWVSYGIC
jgi:hypothetical protein